METKKYKILKVNTDGIKEEEDTVIVEHSLAIFLNGEKFITLLCTPRSLESLAVGFLYSEGVLQSKDDLESVFVDEAGTRAYVSTKNRDRYSYKGDDLYGDRVVTTACGRQRSISYNVIDFLGTYSDRIKNRMDPDPDIISDLMGRFNKNSELFLDTGGVHSCALCDKSGLILFEEDIGRHNALDKILGYALINGTELGDKIILTSGRISSEMVKKVIKAGIPVLVSRSAPSDAAIDMARNLDLTLVGFARGKRMNIYSGCRQHFRQNPR